MLAQVNHRLWMALAWEFLSNVVISAQQPQLYDQQSNWRNKGLTGSMLLTLLWFSSSWIKLWKSLNQIDIENYVIGDHGLLTKNVMSMRIRWRSMCLFTMSERVVTILKCCYNTPLYRGQCKHWKGRRINFLLPHSFSPYLLSFPSPSFPLLSLFPWSCSSESLKCSEPHGPHPSPVDLQQFHFW